MMQTKLRSRPGRVRTPAIRAGIISISLAALVVVGVPPRPVNAQTLGSASATVPSALPPALQAFARAWKGLMGYRATVTVFSAKGTTAQHIVFAYTFHKPSSFTVHVVAGPNAGVTLTWNGGPTVEASRGGGFFASIVKRSIPLHDPLVTTIRGAALDQLSYGAILAHAEQTPGALVQTPGELIAGTPTQALSLVPSDPVADAGLSREIIEISTATQLPIRIEGYEGATLVSTIDFSDVQPEN